MELTSEHNHLTPAVIRQYVTGELSGRQRHAVERHCLDCPLCSDALESFSARPQPSFLGKDLVELNKRLAGRINRDARKTRPLVFQPWSIAATLLVLLLASVIVLTNQLSRTGEPASEALTETPTYPDTLVLYQRPALVLVRNDRRREVARQASADAYERTLRPAGEAKPAFLAPSLNLNPRPEAKVEARNPATLAKKPAAAPLMEPVTDAETTEKKDSVPVVVRSEAVAERSAANAKDRPKRVASVSAPVTVTGKVISAEEGFTLPGISVTVKGSTEGVTTDRNGVFSLLARPGSTLVVGFIGYAPREVALNDSILSRLPLEIVLAADNQSLSEVVVMGYGANKNLARPQPDGGYAAFEAYLNQQIRYPELARQRKVEGTVGLEFTVEPDGTLTDFKVLKSLGYGCDEEAVRVLQQGPKWKPSLENNRPVRKKVKTRIRFKK
ncbi:MAG: TonB family protein [Ferruginibacter sp.]|nr:TonB family protein [Cytophagales bacterium]